MEYVDHIDISVVFIEQLLYLLKQLSYLLLCVIYPYAYRHVDQITVQYFAVYGIC